jgi:hypothetical protein
MRFVPQHILRGLFVDEIDRKLGMRVERRGQGRPAKNEK